MQMAFSAPQGNKQDHGKDAQHVSYGHCFYVELSRSNIRVSPTSGATTTDGLGHVLQAPHLGWVAISMN
jgi:hypothetical protein